MRDLTLRQVEVIRAVHDDRHDPGRRRVPQRLGARDQPAASSTPRRASASGSSSARAASSSRPPRRAPVFEQIHQIYEKMAGLSYALDRAQARRASPSSPSPRCRRSRSSSPPAPSMQVRRRFPELYIDLNVLKIEEAVDYLLLERGEFVAMPATASPIPRSTSARSARASSSSSCPRATASPARARLVGRASIADEPLIGVDASDPYGEITAAALRRAPACRAGSRSRRASPRPWSASCATASASRSSTSSRSPASTCPAWRACRSPSRSRSRIYVAQQGRPRAVELRRLRHRPPARRAAPRRCAARPWRAD